jgi:hypothetical protein
LGTGRAGAVAVGVGLNGRMAADIARELVPNFAGRAMSNPCRHRARSAALNERRAGSTASMGVRVEARLDSAAVAGKSRSLHPAGLTAWNETRAGLAVATFRQKLLLFVIAA